MSAFHTLSAGARSLGRLGTLPLLLGSLVGRAQAQAAGTAHSWDQFAAMHLVGAEVTVTRTDRRRIAGRIVALDTAAIGVERDGVRYSIPAADVREVRRAGVRTQRVLRYGIPIGLVVGALATVAIDSRSRNPEPGEAAVMGAVLIGLPLGALTAAALPEGPPLYVASPGSPD